MALLRRLLTSAKAGLLLPLLAAAIPAGASAADRADAAAAATAVASALQPTLLDVTVNGQAADQPAEFLQDRSGQIYISVALLRAWHIRTGDSGAIDYDGQAFLPASSLPALRLAVADQTQSVAITVEPSAFDRQSASLGQADTIAMTPVSAGVFLNYDMFLEHYRAQTSASGAFEGGVFTSAGAGTASFIASAGGGQSRITRLETTWTIDRPDQMTSLRVGDGISAAGPGAVPVRFAGIQYARNFAVQPGYITMPLPMAGGSAAVPSVVDVYVNSALQGEREVTPGPFELNNIPVPSGGGRVQLVVHDLLGREIVSEQSYYASTSLLRQGLHDFSYEVGALREAFGVNSNRYGELFASATHRYGFSDRVTGEATAQASKSHQMAGAAITAIVFDLAQVGGSVALSHSDRGTGFRVAASAERHGRGLSFGLLADYTSAAYAVLGLPSDRPPPRYTLQAYADLPVRGGGIGVNFLYRSIRGGHSETLAGIFGNWQLAPALAVQLYARHAILDHHETSFGAHLSFALGGRRSASLSADQEHGRGAAYLSYQDDPPPGPGGGFRASARLGGGNVLDAAYVHNFSSATVRAEATWVRDAPGVRLSAQGAIGWLAGHGFASRNLGESFAAVQVADYAGVHVFADNQPVGVTDKHGFLIVPGLRAFDRNRIRIEGTDLPLDVTLTSEETEIRPFGHAGAALSFAARRERGVLMRIRLEDGRDLPAGALVHAVAGGTDYVAVSGGEVYAPGLRGVNEMRATWASHGCRFTAVVPDDGDIQPRLDDLVCRPEPVYATR